MVLKTICRSCGVWASLMLFFTHFQYTYLLNTQLESQRHYFENKIQQVENEAQEQLSKAEGSANQMIDRCNKMEAELSSGEKERQVLDKKCVQVIVGSFMYGGIHFVIVLILPSTQFHVQKGLA